MAVVNGMLRIKPGNFAFHGGEWGDLTLTAHVRRFGEGELAVSYRAGDAGAYHIILGRDFLALQRETNGTLTELGTAPFSTPASEWFQFDVTVTGGEHGGTHMDAPIHFAQGKRAASEVPLQQLIGPAVVIDVSTQAAQDTDYRVTVADIEAWELQHGQIPKGAIILMFSGWGQYWPDKKRYLGTDKPGDVENLHFPSFSREAAEFLVSQRDIDAVGVDTPSIDYGQSKDFIVHQVINGADKPGLENVANLDQMPPAGATLIALPMKIAKGSGAPVRIIAILP